MRKKVLYSLLVMLFLGVVFPLIIFFGERQYKSIDFTKTVIAGYPATDGQILWEAGWETGDTSQWSMHAGGYWGNSTVEVVTAPVRYGHYAGKLALKLAFLNASASAVWPCTGIALAALLIFGYRTWPAIFAGEPAVSRATTGRGF